jgi:hypothetical protein
MLLRVAVEAFAPNPSRDIQIGEIIPIANLKKLGINFLTVPSYARAA